MPQLGVTGFTTETEAASYHLSLVDQSHGFQDEIMLEDDKMARLVDDVARALDDEKVVR